MLVWDHYGQEGHHPGLSESRVKEALFAFPAAMHMQKYLSVSSVLIISAHSLSLKTREIDGNKVSELEYWQSTCHFLLDGRSFDIDKTRQCRLSPPLSLLVY